MRIPDPYRWLEDPDAEETKAFVDAQNELTQSVLQKCPIRDNFKALFHDLYDYEKFGVPFRRGQRYYYSYNTGLQAQNVLYTLGNRVGTLTDEPKLFFDPNTLSDDGTVALMGYSFSESGTLVAMSFSSGGSDWRTVSVSRVDQATGERTPLEDNLTNLKFTSIAWTHDEKGFFYNWYAPPDTADQGTETNKNENQQLRYHVLGQPQEQDVTVLAIPEQPEWMIGAQVTHDGRFLILSISSGCEPVNKLWAVDLETVPRDAAGALDFSRLDFHKGAEKLPIVKVVDDFRAAWDYIGSDEAGRWTLMTNLNAPRYKIVRADVLQSTAAGTPPDDWTEVLAEHPKDVLQWACRLAGDAMVLCYLKDVKSELQLRSFASGELTRELPLPGIGSVGGFSGNHKSSEFFFSFVGFTEPGAQYRSDAADPHAEPTLVRRISTKFDPDAFETKQVFVTSVDGTKVPMFVVHRKGLTLDGTNPTLLYGYGGFNVSLEPSFSVARMAWLLAYDGVVAVANLRGGGEYGIEWRNAGSLGNKQRVFEDFQSCAEYLHANGYSTPATTVIQGGSNGGLLVAACVNQRPDLFVCGLAQVGVMDMLRFAKFTIGHAWITDYGDVNKEEHFKWILPYSPLHNVAQPEGGTQQYPAMLLTTGSHDDRVVPLHTHKLLATLQHVLCQEGSPQSNPILARIETRAGHGAGKPTAKIIEETSDMLSFAATAAGAEWKHNSA